MHAIAALLSTTGGHPLPGFLNTVAKYLDEYSYWAILVLVMLEDFGIPLPGETILIAGAVDAGTGRLNVVLVGVIGFIAAVVGDNIGFAIGHFGGRALVARWGKFIFLNEERLTKAERFFDSHGGKIIAIARFIEGLRQANGIIAGTIRMHWLKFLVFNALGAALWVGCWVTIGYFGGQHITTIYNYVSRYSLYALIVVAVVVLALIANVIRKRRRRKAAGQAEREAAGDQPGEAGLAGHGPAARGATSQDPTLQDSTSQDPTAQRPAPQDRAGTGSTAGEPTAPDAAPGGPTVGRPAADDAVADGPVTDDPAADRSIADGQPQPARRPGQPGNS